MKLRPKIFASIDIGSHALKMKIVEILMDGSIQPLENVHLLVPLGRDTFSTGKLSFDSVKKTCEAIGKFKRLMEDYGVYDCKVVATSAVREAANREYLLDQIYLNTGFQVEVIHHAKEKFLTYQAIKQSLKKVTAFQESQTNLILDIGAGNIQVSISKKDTLVYSQSIKIGALRIKEMLASLEKHTLDFTKVMEEYIEAHLESLDYLKHPQVFDHFIVVGGEIANILQIAGSHAEDMAILSRKQFKKLYQALIQKTPERITEEYNLDIRDADIFVPTLILMREFLDKSKNKNLIVPQVSIVDGLILEYCNMILPHALRVDFKPDIYSNAKMLARRYQFNERHAQHVESMALIIFDRLRKGNEFTDKHRELLQLGCLLHDIGKFIGADPHDEFSYELIRASKLIGLTETELEIVANLARYHGKEEPNFYGSTLEQLSREERMYTIKLMAILRIADALDKSHKQKITKISGKRKGEFFEIRAESEKEILLEKWAFESKADFFEEVFGVKPKLAIKNRLLYEHAGFEKA